MTTKVLFAFLLTFGQMNSTEIQQRLDRLSTRGSALYVAAHPDDENTQLLAYLTHQRGARTAYLSLTRGDGGQNLIGSEQSPLLGVIRTHELLEARRLDKAEQLFTRARDFGYSKSSDEALRIWGKEETLADAVWAIRSFQPDVVITRFPETGETHSHHLASAILAREAFEAAADATRFPEQLSRVEPWQATRLVYNVPNRFMPQEERPDDLVVDIGGYDVPSGLSHGEIAALSRSMHKSQGFGAARRFGPAPERFRHLAGEKAERDLFDGVALDWVGVEGGPALARALEAARRGFHPKHPERIAPDLARALEAASGLADSAQKRWVQRELGALLVGVSGLLLEARSATALVTPGDALDVKVTALARTPVAIEWAALRARDQELDVGVPLLAHAPVERTARLAVPHDAQLSTLAWLEEPPGPGRYRGRGDPSVPVDEPSLGVELELTIAGAQLRVRVPVRHYWVDPVLGERHRDVEILPPLTVTPALSALAIPCAPGGGNACSSQLRVAVRARKPGTVHVEAPPGFAVAPASFEASADGEHVLTVSSARNADGSFASGVLKFTAEHQGARFAYAERAVDHPHVPQRTVLLPSEVRLDVVELAVPSGRIGHIAGPGDRVADSLRQAGFQITDLDDEAIARGDLDAYAAILVGVRAFNTREVLRKHAERLFEFAERGGTVVTQYVTRSRNEPFDIPLLPHPMELGRGRVTDETAKVEFLLAEHPVLRAPHRLTEADFAGWVQERGLYFGESWDEAHVAAPLGMADPGEDPSRGALLVADHGKGRVSYVGLSLFRQLPAGVPGAYRLLANLLAPRAGVPVGGDEPPPVLGSWNRIYLLVGAVLVLVIGLLYFLRRRYGS